MTVAGSGSGQRRRIVTPLQVVAGVVVLALALCAAQLSLPGHLLGITEYDDGAYLGGSLRLVSGAVPYRDFAFVQPPGIVLLLGPVALLGRLVGTPVALGGARVLTALVTALDAGLTAWLVRERGRVAMAVAGGGLALFPLAVTADHTLLLEPYLDALVLAGLVVAFARPGRSRWRLAAAGACFGVAGAVKVWAVLPFLALVACEAAWHRWRAGWLVAGAAVGFGVPSLPFVAMAPAAFVREVLLDQVSRTTSGPGAVPVGTRLVELAGLSGIPGLRAPPVLAVALVGLLTVLVGVAYVAGRARWRPVDVVVVAAAAVSVAGLLAGPGFYPHYAYFTAPFLAALAAIGLTGTAGAVGARLGDRGGGRGGGRVRARLGVAAVAVGAGLLAALAAGDAVELTRFLPASVVGPSGAPLDPGPAIARAVRPGACVVTDDAVLTIEAGRFDATGPGCPPLVDAYATSLADGGRGAPLEPPYPARLVAAWRADLARADDVVLTSPTSAYVPWTPGLRAFFAVRFRPVLVERDAAVYARRARRARGCRGACGASLIP